MKCGLRGMLAAIALGTAGLAGAAPRVLYDATTPIAAPTVQVTPALADEVFFDAVDVWGLRCGNGTAQARFHDRATGAFTRPNVHEVAWLYTWCADAATPVQGLLITENDTPVAHYALRGRYGAVSGVRDQNNNGLNELLLEELMVGGARTAEVALVEFRLPDVVTLGRTVVLEGNCDTGSASQTARRVLIEPGRVPRLSTLSFKRTCAAGGTEQWRALGPAQALTAPASLRLQALRSQPATPEVPMLVAGADVEGSWWCRALACRTLGPAAGYDGVWEVIGGPRPVRVWVQRDGNRSVLTYSVCCVQQIPIGNGSVPTRWLQGLLLEATGQNVTDAQLETLARQSARGGTLDVRGAGGLFRVASRQLRVDGRDSVVFDVWRVSD